MNFLELGLYILTVSIMIATPGPVMILVASSGLKGGYTSALKTIFGTNLASLFLITASILILKGFLSIDERIFLIIKIIGCLYIGYIAYDILKDVFQSNNSPLKILKPIKSGIKKGFLVGISNPKDIIFFSSFFPQFIHIHSNLNISLIILVTLWIILDFLTLSIIYKIFNTLSKSNIYPKILGFCGFLLLAICIYGLYSAIHALLLI